VILSAKRASVSKSFRESTGLERKKTHPGFKAGLSVAGHGACGTSNNRDWPPSVSRSPDFAASFYSVHFGHVHTHEASRQFKAEKRTE
jgi:hypothetical protein